MENENPRVEVSVRVSNIRSYTNIVKIYLDEVIVLLIEDESGIVTHQESYQGPLTPTSQIRLNPRNLTPNYLSQLLCALQVPCCEYLGQQIALGISHDNSLLLPVFVTVNVKFIKERRLILTPVVSAPRGALGDVFQRLVEEQRVESTDLEEDETCSICIENLSENIIRMPRYLHMFHQGCLFEWLGRQNSCPLCRRVPYEEETQILA